MYAYHITLTQYASQLYASGYAGRWNSKGMRLVYTSETRALACLENLVHRGGGGINIAFSTIKVEIPSDVSIKTIRPADLPFGWHLTKPAAYRSCRVIGDQWLHSSASCVLRVPSALISEEYNCLLNPSHPDFKKIDITSVTSFNFDKRL